MSSLSCEILRWAASQKGLSTPQYALLVALAAMSEDGVASASKAELGARVGLKERQTSTVLAELCDLGLITRQRRGGDGSGRLPNAYVINATGNEAPVATSNRQSSAGSRLPVAPGNQQPVAVSQLPVACGELDAPMNKHARGRGLDKPSKVVPRQESYPASVESASAPKRKRGGQFKPEWTLGEKGRGFAGEMGFLNGSADALFARFKDHHMAKGSIMVDWDAAWRTWVRNELKFDHQRRPHVQSSSAPELGVRVRNEPVSQATARRLRRKAERDARREPVDLGPMASVRID